MNKKCFCLLALLSVGMCFGNEALLREGESKKFCQTRDDDGNVFDVVKVRPPVCARPAGVPVLVGVEYAPRRFAVSRELLDDFYDFVRRLSAEQVSFALYLDGLVDITTEEVGIILSCCNGGEMLELRLLGTGNFLKGIEINTDLINRIPKSVIRFYIANNVHINDDCIICLSERLVDLEILYLWNTVNVANIALKQGLSQCCNLKQLVLSCCDYVSSEGLKDLPKELDLLEIIGYAIEKDTVDDLVGALSCVAPKRLVMAESLSRMLDENQKRTLKEKSITVEAVDYSPKRDF